MNQPSLFDFTEAVAARDEAIERVERNAEPLWKTQATQAIRHLATSRERFSTDDVWEYMHQRGMEMPHENRVMGALMVSASKQNWIARTDNYVNSLRPACHRRPVRVWVSLIF